MTSGPVEEAAGGEPIKSDAVQQASTQDSDPTASNAAASGPLSLDRIRQLRASQESEAKPQRGGNREQRPPRSEKPAESTTAAASEQPTVAGTEAPAAAEGEKKEKGRKRPFSDRPKFVPPPEPVKPKIEVPSRRAKLPGDLESELEKAMAGADLDRMLIGDKLLQVGREIEEGQRIQGKVLKVHGEHVFVSLGGANEGMISVLQFETLPEIGSQLEVVVRGYLPQEGLYELTIPGGAISVADWDDLKEGEIVEAKITAVNSGGLECVVGQVRGFIPAGQVAEYRIEDFSEFIDQKVLCVVTQANPARGNLILSRRAVLEREKAEKRQQRLNDLEIGSTVDGTVRKIMDFGAFVDIGGLDGLLHISQLSWERVKHPNEVLQEGQKIKVRVDKVDDQSGKISLSYRSLQDHPWNNIEERFPVGSLVRGVVSRIADFGAFVRLATGVEGLIHVSELANHRVQRVSAHVKEGQELEVKVLSVEGEKQRMSLSLKAAQAPAVENADAAEPEVEEAPRELALPKHRGPLKADSIEHGRRAIRQVVVGSLVPAR
ncbi:MAG: S1 RNA-binding domain-containing protein [Pirellulales bacterium]